MAAHSVDIKGEREEGNTTPTNLRVTVAPSENRHHSLHMSLIQVSSPSGARERGAALELETAAGSTRRQALHVSSGAGGVRGMHAETAV